jgi:uncharacterized protein YgbK (DUF1537 family)
MVSQVVIIADDLTGAADSGAAFAAHGYTTAIPFGGSLLPDVDVLVLSTDSRDDARQAAVQACRLAARTVTDHVGPSAPRWVYKKIDSALRGHPCEELLAVMDEMGESTACVVPALPSEGRITVGGRHYIGDLPLEQESTGLSRGTSDLIERFSCHPGLPIQILGLETVRRGIDAATQFLAEVADGIVVADAQSDADLYTLAKAASRTRLRVLGGSAGFARQFARVLSLNSSQAVHVDAEYLGGPVLVVAGSLHPATAAQVEHLAQKGCPVVRPAQALLEHMSPGVETTARIVTSHLTDGRSVVLTTAGLHLSRLAPSGVATLLADIVAKSLDDSTRVGGLVLTGGDVAAKVLAGIGATVMHLGGEIGPAIPWGAVQLATTDPLPVVTKAGSFGDVDALEAALTFLGHLTDVATPRHPDILR